MRSGGAASDALSVAKQLIRLALEVERGSEPIRGSLEGERGEHRQFEGWMELAAALEAMVESVAPTHRRAQTRSPRSR